MALKMPKNTSNVLMNVLLIELGPSKCASCFLFNLNRCTIGRNMPLLTRLTPSFSALFTISAEPCGRLKYRRFDASLTMNTFKILITFLHETKHRFIEVLGVFFVLIENRCFFFNLDLKKSGF